MKAKELLNEQVGNSLKGNNEELIKKSRVLGTPFDVVSTDGKHFVALGIYKCSADKDSYEECVEMVVERSWELIINVVYCLMDVESRVQKDVSKS